MAGTSPPANAWCVTSTRHCGPAPTCSTRPCWSRHWSRRITTFIRSIVERVKGRFRRTPRYDFSRYGVRVPAVLVSPRIAPHTVVVPPPGHAAAAVFDHTSIPATLRALFAPDALHLTERDRLAPTFHHVVTDSTMPGPRPSPGAPNPDGLPMVPDLSEVHGPALALWAGDVAGDVAAPAAGPAQLDLDLARLDDKVRRRLRLSPTSALLRTRAADPVGGRRATSLTATADLFERTAQGARGGSAPPG